MTDYSRWIEEFLEEPPEELDRFFRWVATEEPSDDARGEFIRDTRRVLRAGGDPASEIRLRGLPHVAGPLGRLVAEWRTVQEKR